MAEIKQRRPERDKFPKQFPATVAKQAEIARLWNEEGVRDEREICRRMGVKSVGSHLDLLRADGTLQ